MQVSRIQTLSRYIGTSSKVIPASTKRQGSYRLTKIRRSGSHPFDLTTLKTVDEGKTISVLSCLDRFFGGQEKKKEKLPNLDEFIRPNPAGKFPHEPLFIPFPNPFAKQKFTPPFLLQTTISKQSPPKEIHDPLLKRLKLLFCLKGKLCKNKQGMLFVKLPNRILGSSLQFLKKVGAKVPDHYHLIDQIGAHIPVKMPHEKINFGEDPSEIGESFYFVITGLHSRVVTNYAGVSKIWYLTFTSFDLEWLRQKYGLTSSLGGQSFHCVIGALPDIHVKEKSETFRISPLAQPA